MAAAAAEAPPRPQPDQAPGETAPRGPGRRLALAVLALLSVQFAALSLYQAWNDSLTADEGIYMATGLASLQERELRLNTDAPFFPKAVNALPLLIAGADVPLEGVWAENETIDAGSILDFGVFAQEFVGLHDRYGNLQGIVFLGRLMPVLEALALGSTLYALGATLFSRSAGLFAAGLWLTTPLAVGFAHVNGIDLAFALAITLSALALVRHLRDPSWRTLAVLALAAGAIQLTRHTGLLYVGGICLAVAVHRWRAGWSVVARDVAVVLVATWALVWVAMLAVAPTRTPVDEASVGAMQALMGSEDVGLPAHVASTALDVLPWPQDYEVGFRTQLALSSGSNDGYLMGHPWSGSQPGFWPLAMLVKLPFTVVAAIVLGPLAWRGLGGDARRQAFLAVGIPTVAAVAFVLPLPKLVGLRYLLPGIALLLVIAAPLALVLVRHRAGRVVLALGALAQLAFLWTSVPHSLAWTAPPFRPGYRMVSESNLDWGQDGYRLVGWLDEHKAHVAYFGGQTMIDFHPNYRPLLGADPAALDWVAVSATMLTGPMFSDDLAWVRAYCNVGTIGGSILLYRFDAPPSMEAGPDAPAGRCSGSVSYRE